MKNAPGKFLGKTGRVTLIPLKNKSPYALIAFVTKPS